MKNCLLFIIILLANTQLSSQNYFDKLYGRGTNSEYISYAYSKGFEVLPQKYLIIYGTDEFFKAHSYFNTAILNENGDTIRHKIYDKLGQSIVVGNVVKSRDDFIYCSGSLYDTLEKRQYFYFVKINTQGDTLWTKKYTLLYNTGYPKTTIETHDGGFLLAGYTITYDFTTHDFVGKTQAQIIKTDSLGNIQWTKIYGEINDGEDIFSVVETPEKDFIFVGRNVVRGGDFQNYMLKIDSTGNLLWTKTYGNANYLEALTKIIKTSDNNYLIGGGNHAG